MDQHRFITRREFLKKAIAAGLLSTQSYQIWLQQAQAMGKIPKKLTPPKSIYELRGTVLVDGVKADRKTRIFASSTVETQSNSYVVFVIGDDAHVLRENSKVSFSGQDFVEQGLRLVTGKLLSVFGHRQQIQQPYQLKTTTATIGIRGTGVYAESHDDRSYVCTCYGSTRIASAVQPELFEDVTTQHHDAPRFVLAEPDNGQLILPAPVFNHTDQELMLVEALVGRQPPFSNIKNYKNPTANY